MALHKMDELFHTLPFPLTKGQKKAAYLIEQGEHCMILGSAGTGKSALMELVKTYFGNRVIFSATTGIANQRLFNYKGGDGTSARIFSLPIGLAATKDWKQVSRYCDKILFQSDSIDAIVIEEAGMLNAEQMALIEARINRANKKSKKRRQRKIQLIFVGDLLQLGTIVSDEDKPYFVEKYGSHLFFKSDAFKRLGFKTCFLDEVMRQDDPTFLAGLDVLRYGNEDRIERCLDWFNRRYVRDIPKGLPIISATNKVVDAENTKAFLSNPNEAGYYCAAINKDYDMKDCPVEFELALKVGLKVMTLINDQEGRYMNGSLAEVTNMTSEGVTVKFAHNGVECLIEPFEFESKELYIADSYVDEDGEVKHVMESRVKGSCIHIPLKQASALSVHRSQGATIATEFVIDLGSTFLYTNCGSFGEALSYVALSRATDINNVYLKAPMKKEHLKVCEETILWLMSVGAIDNTKLSKRMIAKFEKEYTNE